MKNLKRYVQIHAVLSHEGNGLFTVVSKPVEGVNVASRVRFITRTFLYCTVSVYDPLMENFIATLDPSEKDGFEKFGADLKEWLEASTNFAHVPQPKFSTQLSPEEYAEYRNAAKPQKG